MTVVETFFVGVLFLFVGIALFIAFNAMFLVFDKEQFAPLSWIISLPYLFDKRRQMLARHFVNTLKQQWDNHEGSYQDRYIDCAGWRLEWGVWTYLRRVNCKQVRIHPVIHVHIARIVRRKKRILANDAVEKLLSSIDPRDIVKLKQ